MPISDTYTLAIMPVDGGGGGGGGGGGRGADYCEKNCDHRCTVLFSS